MQTEHPFKVGDWVKCIDNTEYEDIFSKEARYRVYSAHTRYGIHWIAVKPEEAESGETSGWRAERFELDEFYMAVLNA